MWSRSIASGVKAETATGVSPSFVFRFCAVTTTTGMASSSDSEVPASVFLAPEERPVSASAPAVVGAAAATGSAVAVSEDTAEMPDAIINNMCLLNRRSPLLKSEPTGPIGSARGLQPFIAPPYIDSNNQYLLFLGTRGRICTSCESLGQS